MDQPVLPTRDKGIISDPSSSDPAAAPIPRVIVEAEQWLHDYNYVPRRYEDQRLVPRAAELLRGLLSEIAIRDAQVRDLLAHLSRLKAELDALKYQHSPHAARVQLGWPTEDLPHAQEASHRATEATDRSRAAETGSLHPPLASEPPATVRGDRGVHEKALMGLSENIIVLPKEGQ